MSDFHIQPIVDLSSGKICGGEVLWRPGGGPLTPELIAELDEDPVTNSSVTQDSFLFALETLSQPNSSFWLSVNLSCSFIGGGQRLLRQTSVMAGHVEIRQVLQTHHLLAPDLD